MQVPADEQAALVAELRSAGCVFAEDEAALLIEAALSAEDLRGLTDRRVEGVPLEQILGWAEFCGLRIALTPGVFVPRRRSELLVRSAIEVTPDNGVVLDLCCGSGAIGAAIATARRNLALHAGDIEPAAIECARRNLVAFGGHVHDSDLYADLPRQLRGSVDVIVANAPYVPTAAIASMPPEARDYEPRVALDGGADGLDLHRRISAECAGWLRPDGHLLIETSAEQAAITAQIMTAAGLAPHIVRDDDVGGTVVVGHPT